MSELTYEQRKERYKKLQEDQKENFESLKKMAQTFGRIRTIWRESDGWGDGFKIYSFLIEKSDGRLFIMLGNDNGTALYEESRHGGSILRLTKKEMEAKASSQ